VGSGFEALVRNKIYPNYVIEVQDTQSGGLYRHKQEFHELVLEAREKPMTADGWHKIKDEVLKRW
jgi:hypothetical protein